MLNARRWVEIGLRKRGPRLYAKLGTWKRQNNRFWQISRSKPFANRRSLPANRVLDVWPKRARKNRGFPWKAGSLSPLFANIKKSANFGDGVTSTRRPASDRFDGLSVQCAFKNRPDTPYLDYRNVAAVVQKNRKVGNVFWSEEWFLLPSFLVFVKISWKNLIVRSVFS